MQSLRRRKARTPEEHLRGLGLLICVERARGALFGTSKSRPGSRSPQPRRNGNSTAVSPPAAPLGP
ncbi:hypothetical protein [Lysobacter gummosus]|uniref:hypothetical protein n=1 Tax=Lysobacter gummosus TaxID=262324 RepID=UPI00362CD961